MCAYVTSLGRVLPYMACLAIGIARRAYKTLLHQIQKMKSRRAASRCPPTHTHSFSRLTVTLHSQTHSHTTHTHFHLLTTLPHNHLLQYSNKKSDTTRAHLDAHSIFTDCAQSHRHNFLCFRRALNVKTPIRTVRLLAMGGKHGHKRTITTRWVLWEKRVIRYVDDTVHVYYCAHARC